MAEYRNLGFNPQLDLEQILEEAQHRWLRPLEICEILRNYHKFHIAPEPPNKPPSGSLFLFDRKVLRYFRKDGHNWRKKKDGKTVKEAHEKLKAGSIDVLHCYYAHGEDDENFQRRSYWMLEEELMHIVLVHYHEVKGNKTKFLQPREDGTISRITHVDSPARSNSSVNQSQSPSLAANLESPNITHLSEYEDDSGLFDIFQSSSRYNSFLTMQQYGPRMNVKLANSCDIAPEKDHPFAQVGMHSLANESDGGLTFTGTKTMNDMASWHEIFERCSMELESSNFDMIVASTCANTMEEFPRQDSVENILNSGLLDANEDGAAVLSKPIWQFYDDEVGSLIPSITEAENIQKSDTNHMNQLSNLSSIDNQDLKKYDSFSRWASNELGEVDDSLITLNSGLCWSTLENDSVVAEPSVHNEEHFDTYLMGPSISHDQLFSIIDFFPNWTYTELETKVLVKGKFLMNKEDVQKYSWSCMFGNIEVPAYILADGNLCCYTPSHKPGKIPFYVTRSNRFACSEIREFEYKLNNMQKFENTDSDSSNTNDIDLLFRFEKLLVLENSDHTSPDSSHERPHSNCTICSMMMEVDVELLNLFKHAPDEDSPHIAAENWLLEEPLKEKLHVWLLHKVGEDVKGPNVLDNEGQGVLHLAAALGYDWAIKPIIAAGVGINFRDVHGWTALHWAAFFGRERTVVTLIALDASPGALTDPTPEFPSGRTPADLASQNGYKGIAGFLAESSLLKHLRELTLKDSKGCDLTESSGLLDYHHSTDMGSSHNAFGGTQTSLKTSLSAVRNATEAAARIYQVFRVQSFHRKKIMDYGDENCRISDEDAIPLISVKNNKSGQHGMPVHAAAIKIQNKFRGWKGRKEFLTIRQQIVKIQAHVRGHQVRKHYRKILWSVGIVEKVILRWRRKGSGLRGFRSDEPLEARISENQDMKEDDYDFLQEGRKQTEARLEKALARVKSMVQYPEAIDQYRRLLNAVEELQESDLVQAETSNEMMEPERVTDLMLELEGLLENDTVMPPS
ncbi:calmodulin-binding transcription activator 2 isoform X2 [Phalaenopsis equestris]|uniref:calmodulin-binding transcription activator 2 isoform X2 n=1 Tax=Phalaenopsis equestris TaxID=78828 RepID=UPI0009E4E968|nr:calmodulin-binding transcription activator 2 isoform X2 [Phalaenopsis equestris]